MSPAELKKIVNSDFSSAAGALAPGAAAATGAAAETPHFSSSCFDSQLLQQLLTLIIRL